MSISHAVVEPERPGITAAQRFCAWIWEVGFTWGCIFQTAAIARLDPGGRSIMLIPAAFALSSMTGPALAGSLICDGFSPLLWLAFATAILPVLAFAGLLARRLAIRLSGLA